MFTRAGVRMMYAAGSSKVATTWWNEIRTNIDFASLRPPTAVAILDYTYECIDDMDADINSRTGEDEKSRGYRKQYFVRSFPPFARQKPAHTAPMGRHYSLSLRSTIRLLKVDKDDLSISPIDNRIRMLMLNPMLRTFLMQKRHNLLQDIP
jgi:hypothetical protein